jgi:cobalamin biosynthesis Mg chelatase CobN
MVVVTLALAVLGGMAGGAPAARADPAQDPCPLPCLSSTTTTADPGVTTTSTTVLRSTTTTRASTATTARTTATSSRSTSTTAPRATTTTTIAVTTSSNILVPGDGTKGAESTTTTVAAPAKVKAGGLSDGTLIALVIAGLVLLAAVVGVLTWRYWVATRPPLLDA